MKTVTTTICIEEIPTDGHSPAKCICDDGKMYFVKYLSAKSFKQDEIHCLVFEWVCSMLLRELNIPTPDTALVRVNQDAIAPGIITINKRTFKDGIIGFGSREIENSDIARITESIKNRKNYRRLLNPEDLVKIALFDLWVDNADRKESNLNLLTHAQNGKIKFYAIDHAFTFGGIEGMRIFNAKTQVSTYRKLISSQYFKSITGFLPKMERRRVIEETLTLVRSLNIAEILDEAFSVIPTSWVLNTQIKTMMEAFLASPERIQQVEYQIKNSLLNQKRKKK